MIERKDDKLILTPLDAKGWPVDLEKWFTGAFDDFELPERPKDSRPIDYLIAGVARCHDWALVTGNSREFKRVKNLKVEKW